MRRHQRGTAAAGAMLGVALLGTASFAFTASNTVPPSNAGAGQGPISGYTVSAVKYTLGTPEHPDGTTTITSVSFDLDHPATTVYAFVTGANGPAQYGNPCASTGNQSWTCTPASTPATLGESTKLVVNAAQ